VKSAFLTVVLGLLLASAEVGASLKNEAQLIDFWAASYEAKEEELCKPGAAERITFSPSARFAVFDQNISRKHSTIADGTRLNILDTECAVNRNAIGSCLTTVSAPIGVRVMGWGADDRILFVVENDRNLLKIEFSKDRTKWKITERVPLANRATARIATRLGPTTSISADQENDRLERIRAEAFENLDPGEVTGIYIGPDEATGTILEDSRDLHLAAITGAGRRDFPATWREVPAAQLAFDASEQGAYETKHLLGEGIVSGTGLKNLEPVDRLPFAKPIVSPKDGRLLGFHNDSELRLDLPQAVRNRIGATIASKREHGYYIKSISIAGRSSHGQILESVNGGKKILIATARGEIEKDCPATAHSTAIQSIDYVSLGSADRPLFGKLFTAPDSKGLVVLFGDGPLNNADAISSSARRYLDMRWSVLAVNYSGSVGNGIDVSRRLASEGLHRAMEADAQATSRFVAERLNPAGETIVHGEGLGALPAIALNGELKRPKKMVLVAPLLRYRPPGTDAADSPAAARAPDIATAKYQNKLDRALLGVDILAAQTRLTKLRDQQSQALLIFDDQDARSLVDDIPQSWDKATLTIKSVNGDHASAAMHPETWMAIENWMDGRLVQ